MSKKHKFNKRILLFKFKIIEKNLQRLRYSETIFI